MGGHTEYTSAYFHQIEDHHSSCWCGAGDARYPFLTPAFLTTGLKAIKNQNPPNKPKLEILPYAVHFLYGFKYNPVYDMEFAFPVSVDDTEHGFDILLDAIRYVLSELEEASKPGIQASILHLGQLYLASKCNALGIAPFS